MAAVVGIARPSSAAAPATCLGLGIGGNYQWAGNLPVASTDVPKLRADGVGTVREDVFWSIVQPTATSTWNWTQYDRLFTTMTNLRVRVLPIVGYGTTWASPGGEIKDVPSTPAGRAAYAHFAAAVVARYGPNGTFWREHRSLRQLPIGGVELWNEPWYAPNPSARDYASLVATAGAAIRQVSRKVLIAANVDDRWTHLTDSSTPYWGQAVLQYAKELAPYVDRWAVHPYSEGQWSGLSPAQDSLRQVTWVQQQLAAAHAKGYIWITEIGYSTAPPPQSSAGYAAYRAPASAYATFLSAAARTTGPNRVSFVVLFTSSRPGAATHPGSWDYGYNLIDAAGRVSHAVVAADSSRCR